MQRLEGHQRYVPCCAIAPSGNLIVTGSNDRTAIIWTLEEDDRAMTPLSRGSSATAPRVSEAGQTDSKVNENERNQPQISIAEIVSCYPSSRRREKKTDVIYMTDVDFIAVRISL